MSEQERCPTCQSEHLALDGCVGESYWCPQCGTLTSWIKEAKTTRTFVPRNIAGLERLRAEVHDCPDCGLACKQCQCFENIIRAVWEHLDELRTAWSTGAIHETDGKGGTRSNRNADCEVILRKYLAEAASE